MNRTEKLLQQLDAYIAGAPGDAGEKIAIYKKDFYLLAAHLCPRSRFGTDEAHKRAIGKLLHAGEAVYRDRIIYEYRET